MATSDGGSAKSWLLPCLVGAGVVVSVGAVAGTVFWWYKRRQRTSPSARKLKLEDFDIPVARVDKLWIYPMKGTHRVELESSDCLARGLKYDRYVPKQKAAEGAVSLTPVFPPSLSSSLPPFLPPSPPPSFPHSGAG